MKGFKLCIGLLISFIIFSLSLNLYSNVNALDLNIPVIPTGSMWRPADRMVLRQTNGNLYYSNSDGQIQPTLLNSGATQFYDLKSTINLDFVKDNYYVFGIGLRSNGGITGITWNHNTNSNFTIVKWDSLNTELYNRYPYCETYQQYNTSWRCIGSTEPYYTVQWYEITLKANITGSYPLYLGSNSGYLLTLPSGTSGINFKVLTTDVIEYEYYDTNAAQSEMNEKDNQDRDNIEQQSSETDSASSDSSSDAEATGTTLLGAFTAFVGALTNAQPSNCNIDMDLGNLDLGVVNLCQLSLPQPIPTIASIMLILFCVPLSIATARKVINLFRSFQ